MRVTTFERLSHSLEAKLMAWHQLSIVDNIRTQPYPMGNSKVVKKSMLGPIQTSQRKLTTLMKKERNQTKSWRCRRDDSFRAPKKPKQFRNMKYPATVKTTPVKLTNAADEIYQLLCSLPDYDFIQQIVYTTKERPNSFIYQRTNSRPESKLR